MCYLEAVFSFPIIDQREISFIRLKLLDYFMILQLPKK